MMSTTPTSIDNKTTKVKRLREDRFCIFSFCFSFILVLFCGGSFFYTLSSNLESFFISKNLVIIFKLNTIKNFYYIQKDFATILVFLGSCHSPREITKE